MGEAKLVIESHNTCLFVPNGLAGFKRALFDRIAQKIGRAIYGDVKALSLLPPNIIPIVGCSPELTDLILKWQMNHRQWIYWDRGYARRVFATDLPRGDSGGYYRWHLNNFQMTRIRDVPSDRWDNLQTPVLDWTESKGGHIVIAEPSPTYCKFHRCETWLDDTIAELKKYTNRPFVVRDKEMQRRYTDRMAGGRRLWDDIKDAHCLVTHGSNAAVEAVILGCPVFVHHSSAAALVGKTDLAEIEDPLRPNRFSWLHSLAYCQYNEQELVDGTLWRLIQ